MQSSVEISKLVEDVSYIISSKLKDALSPVIENQSNTESAILNLPFIQKIVNENRSLKIKNAELETKLALVRENYKRLFLSKVSNEVNTTTSVENNINLEIEECNIKNDFDSISKIEQEIIELNKEEFDSLEESELEESSESDTDNDEEKYEELQHLMEKEADLCNRAVENYKIFYKMQTIPSIEDVFNSTAGIRGWGSAVLSQKNNDEKQEVAEKKVEQEEEQEEEEQEEEEEQDVEENEQEVEEEQDVEENEQEEDEQEEDEQEEEEQDVEENEQEVEEKEQEEQEQVEEEKEQEEQEQEQVEEEKEQEVEEEQEVEDDSEDDELEVEEIMIKGKMYYTDSHLNGDIYRVGDDGDIEDIVGKFENSQAIFF